MAPWIKNVPTMQETWVLSLGWEDTLEKGIATHSSTLAWRIPMDRGAWQATVHAAAKSDGTEHTCASAVSVWNPNHWTTRDFLI